MSSKTWILIFFIMLGGHIIGIQQHSKRESVSYRGGRSYRIDFKKDINAAQVQRDISKTIKERTVVKPVDNNSILDITTSYLIHRTGSDIDSIIKVKLLLGLKDHLPAEITVEQFDREYTLQSAKVLPVLYDRRADFFKNIVDPILIYGCKALLMPLLIIYLLGALKNTRSDLKRWILAALVFSWIGDTLLMFQGQNELFFLAGLGSFLLAHIFYIVFFYRLRMLEKIKPKLLIVIIVAAYYVALIAWLSPYLGEMKTPVYVYGLVISFMFMLAMHMQFIKNKDAGKWMMAGALLFVISDSVLAINKFYQPFDMSGLVIMVTYGLAQWLIVKGAISYIKNLKAL